MIWSKVALFLAGLFFGGALDHVILARMGSPLTPYGVQVGVRGNWGLAVLDGALTALLFWAHTRLEHAHAPR